MFSNLFDINLFNTTFLSLLINTPTVSSKIDILLSRLFVTIIFLY